MSDRENGTPLYNRKGGEKLKKQWQIRGEAVGSPRISGVNEQAVRTEGDGRSSEPVTEDLYGDKTQTETTEVEIQEVKTKTGRDSSLANIMSRKEQDNEDDKNDRDSVDSNENKMETEDKPIRTEADLLNSKYVEDDEVDYNDLYGNLPSEGEQEEYLPEEFRIPSSLGDEDYNSSEFRSETEEEESEEEEDETEEDDEEDEEQEEEEGYKSSSVESVSSVPTFYSNHEEEESETAISRPTTSDFKETPEPTGIYRLSLVCVA